MKKLSYAKLKEKVKNANKKEFYALVIALWWIPLGSFWSIAAIWIRYSSNIKKFFTSKSKLNSILVFFQILDLTHF